MVKTSNVENLSQPLFKKERGAHYKIDFMCENLKQCLNSCSGRNIHYKALACANFPLFKGGLRGIKKPEKLFIYDVGKDEM